MARQKATEYENPTIKISITSNEFRDKPARASCAISKELFCILQKLKSAQSLFMKNSVLF
jgi:hypothetical protein